MKEEEEDGCGSETSVSCLVEAVDSDTFADQGDDASCIADDEHSTSTDSVDNQGVEQVAEGADRNPAGLNEQLLDGVEAERRVQRRSVVVDHESACDGGALV